MMTARATKNTVSEPSFQAAQPAPRPSRGSGDASIDLEATYAQGPTEPVVRDHTTLESFARTREHLLSDELGLPMAFFNGTQVAAVGGRALDRGLAFAHCGADVSVFDFHTNNQDEVASHFSGLGLSGRLVPAGTEDWRTVVGGPFDWVSAEDMANAQPTPRDVFAIMDRLVAPDGFFHFSFSARRGGFIDAMTRALAVGAAVRSGRPFAETARRLMIEKWEGLGSARQFDAWLRDHLANPAARLRRLVDPASLCREALDRGVRIHASTPLYRHPLRFGIRSGAVSVGDQIRSMEDHLVRAALGHATGSSLYYAGHLGSASEIGVLIDAAMGAADECCDDPATTRLQAVGASLRALHGMARGCTMWLGRLEETGVSDLIAGLAGAFDDLAADDIEAVERFCAEDRAFHTLWGMPVHHVVLHQKD